MAYRKPGVTVTQEFLGLVPALAGFNLPSVAVGPAYQLVDDDDLGNYSGVLQAYAYASLIGGGVVDLAELDPQDPQPATKKPIEVLMRNTLVEVEASSAVGVGNGTAFSDATPNRFDNALAGDLLRIVETLGLTILAPVANGVTTDAAGQRNRLTAGVASQFAQVKEGDTVVVTGGTNTNTGNFTVTAKVSADLLILNSDINDGGGASVDVAYSITGDRGSANAGDRRIQSVTDGNNVVLESPLPDAEEPITYSLIRQVGDVEIARVATLSENGFVPSATDISLPGSAVLNYNTMPIIGGDVEADYRALRTDMASEVQEYEDIDAIDAAFGTGQIHPANPLAFALQNMLQNTVTPVNGLGLGAEFVNNEVTAFVQATDVLALTDMYALAVLSHNPVVHTTFKNHVEQLSLPEKKRERIALVNSVLVMKAILQASSTTVQTLTGARTIVSTQVDGEADSGTPTVLTDNTTDQFQDVQNGDIVTILSGTNSIPGDYSVVSVDDNNNLTLSGSIISGGTASDFTYAIRRHDGVDVDGVTVYDRNAQFISNGVASGHFIEITSPSGIAGRHRVATVVSEVELTLDTALIVATHQNPVTYEANRDFSKNEMADNIKGYSEALGSRRVVHCWPDVVTMPVGNEVEELPGYYLGCSVAALVTGLPTQQGFTNLSVSGFLGFLHSTKFFNDDQLDTIAGGGTMVFEQDGPNQPLYIRHQLTTDVSSIKFQELSVTKNVDFIAKFLRDAYASFIGPYNIIDTTLDDLRSTASGSIEFLRDKTRQPRIGGVIKSGSLQELLESETAIDTVTMKFNFNIPIPLNNIDITIAV